TPTLSLHASWILWNQSGPMPVNLQAYVPVPEHDRGPLMLSRPHPECAVTCENSACHQPSLPTAVLLKLTLPRGPTTISVPFSDSHFPISHLGTAVVVAEAATPVTIAASTSRARTSTARRSLFLRVITLSAVRLPLLPPGKALVSMVLP